MFEREGFHEKRGFVLCMNLWKDSRCRDKFEQTLIHNQAFLCLKPYKDRVTVRYHLLLFLHDFYLIHYIYQRTGSTAQAEQVSLPQLFRLELKELYEKVCKVMKQIHTGHKRPENLRKCAADTWLVLITSFRL